MKTREELLAGGYLCRKDIKILLNVSREVADKMFDDAQRYELEKVGRDRMYYYGRKVAIESVLAVTGKSYNMLAKQIKSSDSPAK
ncbi:MAG: hypothetical protein IKG01_05145 [Lachnospiraceae bacterium]|nr:hypothetical protein [Lachnospiraceae bacterium]